LQTQGPDKKHTDTQTLNTDSKLQTQGPDKKHTDTEHRF